MKPSISTGLLSLLIAYANFPATAQLAGLLKEEITLVLVDSGNNWQNHELFRYSYDAYGYRVQTEYYAWNIVRNRWIIEWRSSARFNPDQLPLYNRVISYDVESGMIRWESIVESKYLNGLIVMQKDQIKDYSNNTNRVVLKEWIYDAINRPIQQSSKSFSQGKLTNKYLLNNTYSNDGCLSTRITMGSDYTTGSNFYRKNEYVNDFTCNVIESYSFDESGGVIERWKWDREYVDPDHYAHIVMYSGNNSADWEKQQENWYEYNNDGLLLVATVAYQTWVERYAYKYDDAGHDAGQIFQRYDSLIQDWVTYYESTIEFDEKERPVVSEYLTFASPEDSLKEERTRHEYYYREDGNLQRSVFHFEGYRQDLHGPGPVWNYVNITEVQVFQYRCDGVETQADISFTDIGSVPTNTTTRRLNTYYNLAPCQNIPGNNEQVIFFPNPAAGYFHIFGTTPLGNSSISILDSRGRLVFSNQLDLDNYTSVDISGIPPGAYIVKILSETRLITGRLVVSK